MGLLPGFQALRKLLVADSGLAARSVLSRHDLHLRHVGVENIKHLLWLVILTSQAKNLYGTGYSLVNMADYSLVNMVQFLQFALQQNYFPSILHPS
jgi:hypothetical protein